MIKSLKKNNSLHLKNKIINTLMESGKKKTGEKILLKFLKLLQKSTDKNFKVLLQSAIIHSTSTFKLNEQSIKKGKRKAKKSLSQINPLNRKNNNKKLNHNNPNQKLTPS